MTRRETISLIAAKAHLPGHASELRQAVPGRIRTCCANRVESPRRRQSHPRPLPGSRVVLSLRGTSRARLLAEVHRREELEVRAVEDEALEVRRDELRPLAIHE